jgi:signal transduction histidine kinase
MHIPGGVQMMGDPDRLSQVFINILSNAFKYTNENGSIKVALEQADSLIRVLVEDTGIGIPKEDIKHIFERFYRSDLSRSRGTGGTGLGLTITKALVESHNGKIRIESEEGRGTKFTITFINY